MPQSYKHHPYAQFQGSMLWRAIEKQIASLVKNGDMRELTARKYIVGSICQAVAGGHKSN